MVGSRREQERRKAVWDSVLLVLAAVSSVRQSQRRKNKSQEKDSLEISFTFENTGFIKLFTFRKVFVPLSFLPSCPLSS